MMTAKFTQRKKLYLINAGLKGFSDDVRGSQSRNRGPAEREGLAKRGRSIGGSGGAVRCALMAGLGKKGEGVERRRGGNCGQRSR